MLLYNLIIHIQIRYIKYGRANINVEGRYESFNIGYKEYYRVGGRRVSVFDNYFI